MSGGAAQEAEPAVRHLGAASVGTNQLNRGIQNREPFRRDFAFSLRGCLEMPPRRPRRP